MAAVTWNPRHRRASATSRSSSWISGSRTLVTKAIGRSKDTGSHDDYVASRRERCEGDRASERAREGVRPPPRLRRTSPKLQRRRAEGQSPSDKPDKRCSLYDASEHGERATRSE